jgi:hypothetical protein
LRPPRTACRYHQQQWWTFHADLDVPERFPASPLAHGHGTAGHPEPPNDVIGIADGDAIVFSMPHEHTYFDAQGRPIVIPRVGTPIGELWEQSARATEWLLGVPEPARGMAYFPVYFKREHFAALRAHVEQKHGRPFSELFTAIVRMGFYSQFNIIVAYAYHFHRDEYAWRWFIPDQDNGQPLDRAALRSHHFQGVTHDFSYLDVDDETTRHWPRTWAHWCAPRPPCALACRCCLPPARTAAPSSPQPCYAAARAPPRVPLQEAPSLPCQGEGAPRARLLLGALARGLGPAVLDARAPHVEPGARAPPAGSVVHRL